MVVSAQRCHSDRSGFEGPWSVTPTKFSTQYFKVRSRPRTLNKSPFHSSCSRPRRELTPSFFSLPFPISPIPSCADGASSDPLSGILARALQS